MRETDGIGYLHGNDGRGNMGGHGEHGIARRDDGGSNHRDDPSRGLPVTGGGLGSVNETEVILDELPFGKGDLGARKCCGKTTGRGGLGTHGGDFQLAVEFLVLSYYLGVEMFPCLDGDCEGCIFVESLVDNGRPVHGAGGVGL